MAEATQPFSGPRPELSQGLQSGAAPPWDSQQAALRGKAELPSPASQGTALDHVVPSLTVTLPRGCWLPGERQR